MNMDFIDRRYKSMVDRCTNPKAQNYHRYGARGIKVKITKDEMLRLWVRDNADKMKKPAIDRIDNDGHYEFSNCRFIESVDNVRRVHGEKTHCVNGHEFTKENTGRYRNGKGKRWCRTCNRSQHADNQKRNRERHKLEQRLYRKRNLERCRKATREAWRAKYSAKARREKCQTA